MPLPVFRVWTASIPSNVVLHLALSRYIIFFAFAVSHAYLRISSLPRNVMKLAHFGLYQKINRQWPLPDSGKST